MLFDDVITINQDSIAERRMHEVYYFAYRENSKEAGMPLTGRDRRFLQTIERMKALLLLLAVVVFIYLLCVPSSEKQAATSILGLALCGVFWLTQRLLTFITELDHELTRVVNVISRTLPPDQQKELFRQ